MRRLACVAILAVLFTLLAFPCFAFQNEPDGFRGIKWGTDIKAINGMKHTDSMNDGHMKIYKKEQDDMKIGQAELSKIHYWFWDDSFYMTGLNVRGYLHFMKLREAVFEKFGKGAGGWSKEVQGIESYSWEGDQATIKLIYSNNNSLGTLLINSTKIRAKFDQYNKSKAKKGAEKDF